jgi:hypothetical protein
MPKSSFVLQYGISWTKQKTAKELLMINYALLLLLCHIFGQNWNVYGYGEGQKNPAFHEQDTDH